MGKSGKQKKAEELSLQQQQLATQAFREDLALRQELFNVIRPFAEQLIQFGIDPVQFLQSPQGQALLRPLQEATAQSFAGARQSLVDVTGARGFAPASGVAAGPFASLFGREAAAQSGNIANLIAQSLNLGLQGGNVLQGQQAVFNPQITGQQATSAGRNVIFAPPGPGFGLLQSGIGAGGVALGGFLGRPRTQGENE